MDHGWDLWGEDFGPSHGSQIFFSFQSVLVFLEELSFLAALWVLSSRVQFACECRGGSYLVVAKWQLSSPENAAPNAVAGHLKICLRVLNLVMLLLIATHSNSPTC